MIGHYGVNGSLPCHMCDVQQSELGDPDFNVTKSIRSYAKTVLAMLEVNAKSNGKVAAAKAEKSISIHCRERLPPIWWIPYFNPLWQTPLCWMHNHPLGLLKRILKNFAAIAKYNKSMFHDFTNPPISFIDGINERVKAYPPFPGVQSLSLGVFRLNSEKADKPSMCHLNADQLISFLRMSPTFIYKFLSLDQFRFWMKYLQLCFTVCKRTYTEQELSGLYEHSRSVVRDYVDLFSSYTHVPGVSVKFWNLHANLHVVEWIILLGPIWLYNSGKGERHHVLQKHFADKSNHKDATMDRDIYAANKRLMAYHWWTAVNEEEKVAIKQRNKEQHKFYGSKKSCKLSNELQMLILQKWSFRQPSDSLHGSLYSSMWLHGHFVKPGMYIEVERAPNANLGLEGICLAEIIHFMQLNNGSELNTDFIVIRRFIRAVFTEAHVVKPPAESECPLFKAARTMDVVPSVYCIRRVQMTPRELHANDPYYLYNPWTTDEIFRTTN